MLPKRIASEPIYCGRIIDVRIDRVREDGVEYEREIVEHRGSAVVVPVFDDLTVGLVRQYRHAAGQFLLEVPAGSLEIGEDPESGARRELEEEIGVVAGRFEKLTEFYVSPGFLSELMHVYLASELVATGQRLEFDEMIAVERPTFAKALEMIRSGEIRDAKTICGLMLAGARFGLTV